MNSNIIDNGKKKKNFSDDIINIHNIFIVIDFNKHSFS